MHPGNYIKRMKQLRFIKRINENFTAKVFAYVLSAMICIFGTLLILFYQDQKRNLEDNLIKDGILMVEVAANAARLGVFAEDENQLEPVAETMLSHNEVTEICIHNADKKILYWDSKIRTQTDKEPFCCLNGRCIKNIDRILQTRLTIFKENKRFFEFWQPVFSVAPALSMEALFFEEDTRQPSPENTIIGVVSITVDKAVYHHGLQILLKKSLITSLVFLAISILVTYLIVREVSRPLQHLIEKIRGSGTPTKATDDMGLLHDTFSGLIETIDQSFATINELKSDLEKKVESRTKELAERGDYLEKTNQQLEETLRKLRETQAQLIHSEKMAALGQLVAGIAHEINNTNNFISGALPPLNRVVKELKNIIAQDQKDSVNETNKLYDTFDKLIANITEGARRTTKIVQDLRTFSRPQKTESFIPTDINKNIESTLTLLYSEYKYHIQIIKDFAEDLPKVESLPGQLNQVFLNFLLNSIQAIDARGTIWIRTWLQDDHVHISIRDDGVGIPEEIKDKIFEPFFTTKEVGTGTGLGLSISYGIMRRHKGTIVIKDETGTGSEFELILPCKHEKKIIEARRKIS